MTVSLHETFHYSPDTLGKDKSIEAFAMPLNRADGINVKIIPSAASQDIP